MKKIIIALVAIATMLCSCKKDNASLIVGKWAAESATESEYENGKIVWTETEFFNDSSYQWFFVFNADGTYSNVEIEGSKQYTNSGTYLVLGSQLSLSDAQYSYTIGTLNNSTLVLRIEEKDGNVLEVEEITFKRTK